MPLQRYGELKHLPINPALREYIRRSGSPADPVVESLVERTAELGDLAVMMVPVEQAALLTMLTRMLSTTMAVDIGTFTGLSALAMAKGLTEGGRVLTCDVTDRWSDIAHEHWKRAGVANVVDFRLGPANETLTELPSGTVVEIAFLDADKENYEAYYQTIVPLLAPGGLLIVDNVLFNGYVLDPSLADEGRRRNSAVALRHFNATLAADNRMATVMLPVSDGLTIAQKLA